MPSCVAAHARSTDPLAACDGRATDWVNPDPLAQAAQDLKAAHPSYSIIVVDPNIVLCNGDMCYGVLGGVIVYRDTNHLTATIARTLAPLLQDGLAALDAG